MASKIETSPVLGPVTIDLNSFLKGGLPTWVLVSAGFDAHRVDPLAHFELTSGDFAGLARLAASFAPQPGRIAMFLEGGYDLHALRDSVRATMSAVLGIGYDAEAPSKGGPGMSHIVQLQRERQEAIESLHSLEGKGKG